MYFVAQEIVGFRDSFLRASLRCSMRKTAYLGGWGDESWGGVTDTNGIWTLSFYAFGPFSLTHYSTFWHGGEVLTLFISFCFTFQVSLQILADLLAFSGLPSVPVLDSFVKSVGGLLELLSSGRLDKLSGSVSGHTNDKNNDNNGDSDNDNDGDGDYQDDDDNDNGYDNSSNNGLFRRSTQMVILLQTTTWNTAVKSLKVFRKYIQPQQHEEETGIC